MADTSVRVASVRALLHRAAVDVPMVTSFGRLDERPTLIVEVRDDAANRGWGEVWCNFPKLVAEHRLAFLKAVIAPMLEGQLLGRPDEAARLIDRSFGVQAIQAGEEGTLASIAAGIDQALWDLIARRHEQPLWRVLGGRRSVRVYASGVDPAHAGETISAGLGQGHTGIKPSGLVERTWKGKVARGRKGRQSASAGVQRKR